MKDKYQDIYIQSTRCYLISARLHLFNKIRGLCQYSKTVTLFNILTNTRNADNDQMHINCMFMMFKAHFSWHLTCRITDRLAFSFASTADEASGGTEGQIPGLGQGNMLKEALCKKKERFNKGKCHRYTIERQNNGILWHNFIAPLTGLDHRRQQIKKKN